MKSLEAVKFEVITESYNGLDLQDVGVPPQDTPYVVETRATLEQEGIRAVNVQDLDQDGRTFLSSHNWGKIGFHTRVTSVDQEGLLDTEHKGYNMRDVMDAVAPSIGRFSVMTVAQPYRVFAPHIKSAVRKQPELLEALQSERPEYLFAVVTGQGNHRFFIETSPVDGDTEDVPWAFDYPVYELPAIGRYDLAGAQGITELPADVSMGQSNRESLDEAFAILEQISYDQMGGQEESAGESAERIAA